MSIYSNGVTFNGDSATIVEPDLAFIDICTRYQYRYLPDINRLYLENGKLIANITLHGSKQWVNRYSLYDLGSSFYTPLISFIRISSAVLKVISLTLIEMMIEFDKNNIHIYPDMSQIYLVHLNPGIKEAYLKGENTVFNLLWFPTVSQVRYFENNRNEFILRNGRFFETLKRKESVSQDIDPAIKISNGYSGSSVYYLDVHMSNPEADLEKLHTDILNGSSSDIDFDGKLLNINDARGNDLRVHTIMKLLPIEELLTYPVKNGMSDYSDDIPTLLSSLAQIVNEFRRFAPKMNISAMFMAIDMYFRMKTLDTTGVSRCIRMLYGNMEQSYGSNIRNLIIETNGQLGWNNAYRWMSNLSQVDNLYMNIISERPYLYPLIDYCKWSLSPQFTDMGMSILNRNISIEDYFNIE